ncbi:ribonuclease H2, subunit C [Mycena maculata]|uniref:Ribonuclease H2, subunit C n=1 Tax=Mycena maculata TaxID=230809 RepID=A0AAD7KA69_9AGAR|nr:ribonuclease H2, subunit C [Mycena maculata]
MAAAPTLSITPISEPLPNACPNLLPFHVNHDGPAPIATYFLVEAANEHVTKPPPDAKAPEDSDMVVDTDRPATTSMEPEVVPPASGEPHTNNSLSRRVREATTRFMATFRGRTMQGLKVELPQGYTGVIMAGEGAPGTGKANALKTKIKRVAAKARGSKTGRLTRSATHVEDEYEADEDQSDDQRTAQARALMPTAQFSSFVLWHPDIPVDPGRDEYLRSLSEWIRLADEIHRF